MISDLSASIRARMKGQFSPLNDDILMLNRGAATGVSSRLWDTQASVTSGESGEIINSVASDYFVNSDVSPRDPLLFQQEDESLYDWMKRKQQIGDIGALAADEDGNGQVTRGVIRFLKNRIYPVFRAKLFRKSDLMLKKCRFALRKHENHPFLAIFSIFGNSVLSQPTIRHTPTVDPSTAMPLSLTQPLPRNLY